MNVASNPIIGEANLPKSQEQFVNTMAALSGIPTGERITRSAFNVDTTGLNHNLAGYSANRSVNELQETNKLDSNSLLEMAGLKKRRRIQLAGAIAATTAALTAAGTLLSLFPLVLA
jgi:hypothetical protein